MTDRQIFKRAIRTYGNFQKVVAMEEMSELIKELSKDMRGELDRNHLIEEFADVTIMLDQLRIIYGIRDEELRHNRNVKIKRLREHLCKSTTEK